MKEGSKGINPIVSAVFVLVITIAGIGLVMNIGMPAIDKARENTLLDEAEENLEVLQNMIDTVRYGAKGTSRAVTLDVEGGRYYINRTSDIVKFKHEMRTDFLPSELCRSEGNIQTRTFGTGRALDLRFNEGQGNTTYDCSRYDYTGNIYGANWTDTKYGTALNFSSNDHVNVTGFSETLGTVVLRVKTASGNWSYERNNETFYTVDGDTVTIGMISGSISSAQISSFRIYDRTLSDEEVEALAKGGGIGRPQELQVELSPGVNITQSLQFGTGTHRILVGNQGTDGERVKVRIKRI